MPGGGAMLIEARNASITEDAATSELSAGDYVALTVSDSGEGIPPEVMERILEPFFTTKPVGKGTGLGLPMVYGFAQRSGGGLVIRSEPGEGTEVAIYLPRAREGVDRETVSVDKRAAGAGLPARILVVDDEPGVRSVTAAALRDLGHTVHETPDAQTGLEFLRTRRSEVDLVLVDFAMPGMNGVEFVQQARADHGPLPVILLTGYFDVEQAPADVLVMHKPFTQLTLEAAVGSVLAARAEVL